MKSIKNHISLILALFSILFAVQIFIINDRALQAYEEKLSSSYSMIVVSSMPITGIVFQEYSRDIDKIEELSADTMIKQLEQNVTPKNIALLKLSLPHFYRLHLKSFPTSYEVKKLTEKLKKNSAITRVEDFSNNHDTVYKLLLLFKQITQLFTGVILLVTLLLIAKELRIWQLLHSERMSIMGLFGAPVWLRSAVLFRVALLDALVSSLMAIGFFYLSAQSVWTIQQLTLIGIDISVFEPLVDGSILLGVAMGIAILLASLIVVGYKEEV